MKPTRPMTPTASLTRAFAALLFAGVAITAFDMGMSSTSEAKVVRRADRAGPATEPNAPLLAIVGLAEQRVTIYDATGKIMQSPVSSGQSGLETPAGIYSVVQKEEDHTSNIYDDASMPFMERITWTGIALHAGDLPGYPASHGCVRMPYDFAQELYSLTKLGLRVVVAREDIAPADIASPSFFKPKEQARGTPAAASADQRSPADAADSLTVATTALPAIERRTQLIQHLRGIASARAAEGEAAIWKEKDAREAAARLAAEAAPAIRAVKQAETGLAKEEADLKAAETTLAAGGAPAKLEKAGRAKAQAMANIEARRAQLQALQAQSQGKIDAVKAAEQEVRAAAVAISVAAEAADEATQNMSPVSVFISRKTQRLYIRKANMPVFEAPVSIRDSDKMIGSFVFTALEHDDAGEMRWNVVSLFKSPTNVEPAPRTAKGKAPAKNTEPAQTDAGAATKALERLAVTDEARQRISEVVLPGSSLIISDEGPSIETGRDTDFVVIMSGEPQGGIAIRQKPPRERDAVSSFDEDNGGRRRSRRSGGGGGGGFFSLFD